MKKKRSIEYFKKTKISALSLLFLFLFFVVAYAAIGDVSSETTEEKFKKAVSTLPDVSKLSFSEKIEVLESHNPKFQEALASSDPFIKAAAAFLVGKIREIPISRDGGSGDWNKKMLDCLSQMANNTADILPMVEAAIALEKWGRHELNTMVNMAQVLDSNDEYIRVRAFYFCKRVTANNSFGLMKDTFVPVLIEKIKTTNDEPLCRQIRFLLGAALHDSGSLVKKEFIDFYLKDYFLHHNDYKPYNPYILVYQSNTRPRAEYPQFQALLNKRRLETDDEEERVLIRKCMNKLEDDVKQEKDRMENNYVAERYKKDPSEPFEIIMRFWKAFEHDDIALVKSLFKVSRHSADEIEKNINTVKKILKIYNIDQIEKVTIKQKEMTKSSGCYRYINCENVNTQEIYLTDFWSIDIEFQINLHPAFLIGKTLKGEWTIFALIPPQYLENYTFN